MLLDHVAWVLMDPAIKRLGSPTYPHLWTTEAFAAAPFLCVLSPAFHSIGRTTMLLMLFFLSEGLTYTKSVKRYAARLLLWAFLSEIPFDLAFHRRIFYPQSQNVFFTLFLALLAIWAMRALHDKPYLYLPVIAACMVCAWALKSDYGFHGVVAACVIEFFHKNKILSYCAGCAVMTLFSLKEITAFLGVVPIVLYNGKRGPRLKYLFYVFYPTHLLLLYLLRILPFS